FDDNQIVRALIIHRSFVLLDVYRIVTKSSWLNNARTKPSLARIVGSEEGATVASPLAFDALMARSKSVCLRRKSRQADCSSAVGRRDSTCSNATTTNAASSPTCLESLPASSRLQSRSILLLVITSACCGTMLSPRL